MTEPTRLETPIVALVQLTRILADRYPTDAVLGVGVAEIIEGTRTLLVGDWGSRLDRGKLDEALSDAARVISYCLDHSRFGCTDDG